MLSTQQFMAKGRSEDFLSHNGRLRTVEVWNVWFVELRLQLTATGAWYWGKNGRETEI